MEALEFSPVTSLVDETKVEQVLTEKKRGRGRPRKDEQKAQQDNAATISGNGQSSTLLNDIRSKVAANSKVVSESAPTPEQVTANAVEMAKVIDGLMVITLMDAFCPMVVKILFKKKFGTIKEEEMALSDIQKKSLLPLADEFAKYVGGYINPMAAFFIVSSTMYYQNANQALNTVKR